MPYYPPRYLFRRHAILRVLHSGKTFLEVGPGNMQLTQELLNHFQRGTVIDYSRDIWSVYEMLDLSIRSRLELLVIDFLTYDLRKTFDCVLACEVLEHVPDDAAFLQRLYAALNDHGQLVLSVPARMKSWSLHDCIAGHVRRYERDGLVALMNTVGFKSIRVYAYGFPFVNLLQIPRILLARRQFSLKMKLSLEERTKMSGIAQTADLNSFLGLVLNPLTIYPLALFSTIFQGLDWSDAYLVTAVKCSRSSGT
jgi:SAM-dependent methyltransferase